MNYFVIKPDAHPFPILYILVQIYRQRKKPFNITHTKKSSAHVHCRMRDNFRRHGLDSRP